MLYKIENKYGKEILSNIFNECDHCTKYDENDFITQIAKCKFDHKKRKIGLKSSKEGKTFLCTDSDKLLKSNRIFKEKLNIYHDVIEDSVKFKTQITDAVNKDITRLLHNLTSLNAHNIQEVYALVPQSLLTQNIRKQISTIKDYIYKNPNEAALTFLRIAKNNISIKTEFTVFKKLYESSPTLSIKNHPIRKVVLNVLHIFFQDFTDKDVHVRVEDFNDKLQIDYESVHVALYHLIDNATKYIHPGSQLYVNFKVIQNTVTLQFKMVSLEIKDFELKKILNEGYSGDYAKKSGNSGDGIGMSIITKLLALNNAELHIHKDVNPSKRVSENGLNYQVNSFDVLFDVSLPPD